jgi:hypothetical protein
MWLIKITWEKSFILKWVITTKVLKTILKHAGTGYHFVMEATGVYYVRLAFFLQGKKCTISVVNALKIKRYIQMQPEKNKSDKKDAQWICRYAIDQEPVFWEMPDSTYFESKQMYNTIRQYSEQIKRFKNQLHSLRTLPVQNKETIKSLEKMKGQFENSMYAFVLLSSRRSVVLTMHSFFCRLIVKSYCTTTKCFCFQEFKIKSIPDVFK